MVENRTAIAVSAWLAARDDGWKARVDTVAIDPYQGYATALRGHLDHATVRRTALAPDARRHPA